MIEIYKFTQKKTKYDLTYIYKEKHLYLDRILANSEGLVVRDAAVVNRKQGDITVISDVGSF